MRAGRSFGIGREFAPTGAGQRTGRSVTGTLMLTERDSTSGVHGASGGQLRVGRAVSGAIGATWSISSGTNRASVGASRLSNVRVDGAII